MYLTYKYKLLPTRSQRQRLDEICEYNRILYNAALQSRIDYYTKYKDKIISKEMNPLSLFDQMKQLKELRTFDNRAKELPVSLLRGTLVRLNEAYKSFFKRCKKGSGKKGYPRFKSKNSMKSFSFSEFTGIRLINNRLKFKSMPSGIRIYSHRPIPADIKSCVFKKKGNTWWICLAVDVPVSEPHTGTDVVGIDMGLSSLCVLSDGYSIDNIRVTKEFEKKLRKINRELSRCKRGSNRRKKVLLRRQKLCGQEQNKRQTYLHKVSRYIVDNYDVISIEDLNTKGLLKNRHLTKAISDASWAKLKQYLIYKAESAGKQMIEVDPKHTSQDCSTCGYREKKTLSQRTHNCSKCRLVMDRDLNAAINIAAKAVVSLAGHKIIGCNMSVPRKLNLTNSN